MVPIIDDGYSASSSAPIVMDETTLLTARNISKAFQGNLVLSDVDLTVRCGEIHALIGENGAGKSTLMKILGGVHRPDKGQIALSGREFQPRSPREAIAHGIVVIHQELSLTPHLCTEDNIFLGHYPVTPFGTVDRKLMRLETLKLLHRLSVRIDPALSVRRLSVAQQQMVEIAKALSLNPKILILDEPTAVLDDESTEVLFQVLRRLREQNLGIIYISHRMEEIFEIADRVTVLRDGKCTGTAYVKDVNQDWLIRHMIGRNLLIHEAVRIDGGTVALRVQGLSRKGLFDNISFAAKKGEILGIAGLVGAGRTEIAKTIFGLVRASSGSIEIFGKILMPRNPGDAIKAGLVYVTEDRKAHGLFLNRPVFENITAGYLKRFFKFPRLRLKAEWNFVREMISRFDIRMKDMKVPVRTLSGGNQQKVLIARAVGLGPKILILDEPTRGVDIGAKQEIYSMIEGLAAKGIAIILISSEMAELLRLSDVILVLREGRISANLTRESATEDAIMKAAAFDQTKGETDE
jgi:ABC-type sugar transport system ATPase subunit